MAYCYEEQKKELFTERGAEVLLKVRDKANDLLESSGAFMAGKVFCSGDAWTMLAALDYMVERREIAELTGVNEIGQRRVFVAAIR